MKSLSRVRLFATRWTVAYQASPSMRFPRQEYWSGLPFPSPGDLPHPGIEPRSPALETDTLTSEPPGKTTLYYTYSTIYFTQCKVIYVKPNFPVYPTLPFPPVSTDLFSTSAFRFHFSSPLDKLSEQGVILIAP